MFPVGKFYIIHSQWSISTFSHFCVGFIWTTAFQIHKKKWTSSFFALKYLLSSSKCNNTQPIWKFSFASSTAMLFHSRKSKILRDLMSNRNYHLRKKRMEPLHLFESENFKSHVIDMQSKSLSNYHNSELCRVSHLSWSHRWLATISPHQSKAQR